MFRQNGRRNAQQNAQQMVSNNSTKMFDKSGPLFYVLKAFVFNENKIFCRKSRSVSGFLDRFYSLLLGIWLGHFVETFRFDKISFSGIQVRRSPLERRARISCFGDEFGDEIGDACGDAFGDALGDASGDASGGAFGDVFWRCIWRCISSPIQHKKNSKKESNLAMHFAMVGRLRRI